MSLQNTELRLIRSSGQPCRRFEQTRRFNERFDFGTTPYVLYVLKYQKYNHIACV